MLHRLLSFSGGYEEYACAKKCTEKAGSSMKIVQKGVFLVRITCPKRRKTSACISENANTHRKRGAVIKYAFTTCYCENNDQKCAYVQEKPSSKTSGKS